MTYRTGCARHRDWAGSRRRSRLCRSSSTSSASTCSQYQQGGEDKANNQIPFLDHHLVEVIRSQPVNQKIRGMTEKYVLREAARDVITDTVYRRQKHPFLSPPATLNPKKRLSVFVQDTLRGSALSSIPFFDQRKVVNLLDSLNTMDEGARVANDQVLMTVVSACVLHERFQLSA